MRYTQEAATQSLVDQSSFLGAYSVFSGPPINTAQNFTPDTSAYFSAAPAAYQPQPVDPRQRLPSHSSVPSVPLSLRGPAAAVHPTVRPMSTREQYSSGTPQFGRRAEAARNRSPSNFHTTVMSRASWIGGNAQPLPSTYQSSPDSREHSGSPTYSSRAAEDVVLPMEDTEQLGTLQYIEQSGHMGPTVEASISATIHKNFFIGEKFYTCYRRNYMACNCSFSLSPYLPGVQMHFTPMGSSQPLALAGFAMCISAVVSAHQHQEVTILQHTPKRDKGPINEPSKQSLGPKKAHNGSTPPHLGGYHESGVSSSRPMYSDIYGMNGCQTLPTEHNFDRIQFKTATANNGERRAGQQCYRLVVELWGDLGSTLENADRWVKVAIQKSTEIVVRGRSPGHYQKERRKSQGSGGGSGPSPHGNYGGSPAMDNYGSGGMLGGQHHQPNGYGAPGPYDHRGGMYGSGLRPTDLGRREMAAYSLDSKAFDTGGRLLPSSYTNPSPYGADAGFYQQQHAQATGVSPQDLLGKPRGDPDMGLLPRPEPPQRMGQLDGRCSNGGSGILPLPSLATGGFVSSL